MVFFFTTSDGYVVYMGRDKYENEELIKHMWPEDVWFHVDDLSSAHVYLRMKTGQGVEDIPKTALNECCQLVKANSIEGSKKSSVRIVYTMWSNLKKVARHDVGTVTFHDMSKCHYVASVSRNRDVLRVINRTKTEPKMDLAKERARRDEEERLRLKAQTKAEAKQRAKDEKERRAAAKAKDEAESYKSLFDDHDRGARRKGKGRGGAKAAAPAAEENFFGGDEAEEPEDSEEDDDEAIAAAMEGLM